MTLVPVIDEAACSAHGDCADVAPTIFRVDDVAVVIGPGDDATILAAAEACPAVAISVVDARDRRAGVPVIAPGRPVVAAGLGLGALAAAAAAPVVAAPAVAAPAVAAPAGAATVAAQTPVALTTRSSGTPVSPSAATLSARAQSGRRVATSGRIGMPSGLSLPAGCSGRVTVTFRRNGQVIRSRVVAVGRSAGACRWSAPTTLPPSTPAGSPVSVTGRFGGNSHLRARSTPVRTVTVRG